MEITLQWLEENKAPKTGMFCGTKGGDPAMKQIWKQPGGN